MTPEHKLMNEIKIWCGEHDLLCFRINVGNFQTIDGRWINTGLPVGASDLWIFDNKGHCFFIETKIKPRKPTPQQLQFLTIMRERGFNGAVIYSLDEFIGFIKKEL